MENLTIDFKEGQITGIIGPNGSGKSTLVNLLTGMIPLDSGTLVLADAVSLKKIHSAEVASFGMTRTFQEVRLFEQMTVLDNILVVLTERNIASAIFEKHSAYHLEQAKEVLELIGLWEKKDDLAASLSYGQRKLLEIARVVAMTRSAREADVFFFDEPFAGLFPEMVKIVSGILKDLRTKGKTVILIEHNMDLIRELSDHVIVMDAGKFLAQGSPKEVLALPEVIEAYLGE